MIFSRVKNWDLTLEHSQGEGKGSIIHMSVSSWEELSVMFSYSIPYSV